MSPLARGAWLAVALAASAAQADVFTVVIADVTPAAGTPVRGWSMSLGPGALAGKVNGSSITFSQDVVDAVKVLLMKAHARQSIIPSIVLEARATATSPVAYRVTFTNARVSSVDVSDTGLSTAVETMQWSVKAASVQLEQLVPAPPAAGTLKVELE